jgi:hypothetical protein
MSLRARLVIATEKAARLSNASYEDIMQPIQHINHNKNLKERLLVARNKAVKPMSKDEADALVRRG